MLRPAFLFTDGAVLQREKEVPVFGECDGGRVWVSYCGCTAEATVRNGKFEAILPPMPVGLAGDLVFKTEKETVTCTDVLTGDVYLAGGQSNMEHPFFCTLHGEDSLTRDEGIRLFTVPRRPWEGAEVWGWHFYPVRSVDTPWQIYDAESVECFSAVAAFFAKRLRAHTDVPIGLVSCNWGATTAEAWLSRETLLKKPLARFAVDDYDARFAGLDMAAYMEKYDTFQRDMVEYMTTHPTPQEDTRERGAAYSLRHHFTKTVPEGPYHYHTPAAFRRTMLDRVTPYAICGVLWYQGESNTGITMPHDTRTWFAEVMETLVEDFRAVFRAPDLAFYIAQISTHPSGGGAEKTTWHPIREVHEQLALQDENVYTVPTVDIGEYDNIHPIDKKTVGERLALCALANRYGVDIPWRSPRISRIERIGDCLRLSFTDGEGLYAEGGVPQGFFATVGETRFAVSAKIKGDTVVIPCPVGVDAIGYCDQNFSPANLYNRHGLPLFPFRRALR